MTRPLDSVQPRSSECVTVVCLAVEVDEPLRQADLAAAVLVGVALVAGALVVEIVAAVVHLKAEILADAEADNYGHA